MTSPAARGQWTPTDGRSKGTRVGRLGDPGRKWLSYSVLSSSLAIVACDRPAVPRPAAPVRPLPSQAPPVVSVAPPVAVEPLAIVNGVPGDFSIRAGATLELSTAAEIEVQSPDGQWSAYTDLDGGKGFHLVESCEAARAPCRTLVPGQQLNLAAWSGSSCSAQCAADCPGNPFHSGVHRLVLHACADPAKRFVGAEFEMPASTRELWRWRAAANTERGTVLRLDPQDTERYRKAPLEEYVAGFRAIPNTEQPLSPALLSALAIWLRHRDAFVQYDLHKRCFQGHLVGLRLQGATPHAVEIALNFACTSVFIRLTDGRGKLTQVSFFDPSWSEVMPIVRQALPHDPELAALFEIPSGFPANFDKPAQH